MKQVFSSKVVAAKTSPTKPSATKAGVKNTVKKSISKKRTAKKTLTSQPKSAPRSSVKKRVTKTTVSSKYKKRSLVTAPDEQSFWVCDGQILNNLEALANSFQTMDKLIYSYHVQKSQNDFAEWVELILDDAVCATALRKARTPKTAHTIVVRHFKYYIV